MATPRVSVIVPSYNHAPFLRERLDSILGQTFQDFEVLFLDDASPDSTREVFAPYAGDPRIRAVFNEVNSGSVFRQWNRGLALARGEFVWIAESDDRAAPHFLETLVGALEAKADAVLACCDSLAIDEGGRALNRTSEWFASLGLAEFGADFAAAGAEVCRRCFNRRCVVPNASSAVFRRAAAARIGGAPEHLRLSGDWWFWVSLLGQGGFHYVAEPLNHYRQHAGTVRGATRRNAVAIEEAYLVARHALDLFPVSGAALETLRTELAEDWFWRSLQRDSPIPWRRQRAIWQAARRVDPRVGSRLLRRWLEVRWRGFCRRLGRR